jgi:hypothetical protein
MTQEFDPKKSYLKIKAHEKMIAYVGFGIRFGIDDQRKEGVIKISSFQRPYGGGYITLTFIVDTEDNQELKAYLKQLFNNLTEDSLKPYLEKDMEKIVKVSLDSLEEIPQWYIEEISVHFSNIDERDSLEEIPQWYIEEISVHFSNIDERVNVLIEEKLIPALESGLSFSFDPVEWWPADKPVEVPDEASLMEKISLKTLFRKWFKAD